MDDEDDPLLAQAIRASLGLPPLRPSPPARASGSQNEPLFIDDSDDERKPQNGGTVDSDSDSLPDFAVVDESELNAYYRSRNRPRPPGPARLPPNAAPPRRTSPIVVPPRRIQPSGSRDRPHHPMNGYDQPLEVEEPEMDAELRLAMMRSKKEEDERIAAVGRIQVPVPVAADDEEEQMKRAIEASMRPATPPPQSDDIDEDEEDRFSDELRQAIELSRKERERNATSTGSRTRPPTASPPPARAPIPPQLSNSLDREPSPIVVQEQAVKSLATPSLPGTTPSNPTPPPAPAPSAEPVRQSSAASSLLGGMSRAEMERERLERANKRQLSMDGASGPPQAKKPRLNSTTTSGPKVMSFGELPKEEITAPQPGDDGVPRATSGGEARGSVASVAGKKLSAGVARVQPTDRLWDGEMGYTTNSVCRAPGKYFGIKELIGETSTLKYAIVSTYCFEPEWVASLFPTTVPTIMVSQPPGPGTQYAGRSTHGSSVPGIWSCYPFLPGWPGNGGMGGGFRGTCHMKFMLLFYNDGRMRIVISSANLMSHDWDIIENGVWVQDFRPLTTPPIRTDFGDQWEMILDSLGLPKTFKLVNPVHHNLPFTRSSDIHKWDFSRVIIRLVASIGGGGKDGWNAMDKIGQCRLSKILRDEGWVARPGQVLKSLEAQGSSLGNYSPKWTTEFFKNARGLDARNWLGTKAGSEHGPIKVIYPSLATVDATRHGRNGGGTFFCDQKKWTDKTKHLFYDAVAKRGPVLMHIKMLVAIFEPSSPTFGSSPVKSSKQVPAEQSGSETEDEEPALPPSPRPTVKGKEKAIEPARATGWMYMGSHNWTPSAWGNCSIKKDGTPTINTANYELGIVFPLRSSDPQKEADRLATWKRPARKYTKEDRPWIQSEHLTVEDD